MSFKYSFTLFLILITCFNYRSKASHLRYPYVGQASSNYNNLLLNTWFGALQSGHFEIIKSMIMTNSIDINAQDKMERTALMIAAHGGHENIVKLLLQIPNININIQGKYGVTALIAATLMGHENIVKLLLQAPDANVNYQDKKGSTVLMIAAYEGHENIVKILLQVPNININIQDKNGETALMRAVANGHENIAMLLLQVPGININAKDKNGDNALLIAINLDYVNIAEQILKFPEININADENDGNTALMSAAFYGHENIVKLLLQFPGINVNAQDKEGFTALLSAIDYVHEGDEDIQYVNIIKLLLEFPGINIDAQDKDGKTAYMLALERIYPHIALLIKEKINKLTNIGFEAIKTDNLLTFKMIHDQIGNKVVDVEGNTFLHAAFAKNAINIISFLLNNSKEPHELLDTRNNNGQLALELLPPTSQLFKFFFDMAYGAQGQIIISEASKKRKRPEDSITSEDPGKTPEKSTGITTCTNCGIIDCIKRCSQCQSVYYCSEKCHKADWTRHKKECKYLKKEKCAE